MPSCSRGSFCAHSRLGFTAVSDGKVAVLLGDPRQSSPPQHTRKAPWMEETSRALLTDRSAPEPWHPSRKSLGPSLCRFISKMRLTISVHRENCSPRETCLGLSRSYRVPVSLFAFRPPNASCCVQSGSSAETPSSLLGEVPTERTPWGPDCGWSGAVGQPCCLAQTQGHWQQAHPDLSHIPAPTEHTPGCSHHASCSCLHDRT